MFRPQNLPPLLFPLVFINLFGHVVLSGGRVTSALFALQSGASELLVGLLIGLYGVLPMLLSLFMGRWVDRVGPFVPLRAGIAASLAGVLLPVLYPDIVSLFGTAILCGLGFTMVSVAAQHTVGHLGRASPADRVANFGWLALGHSSSAVLGPILVGVMIDYAGFRAAFGVCSVSAAIALVLVLREQQRLRAVHTARPHREQGDVWSLVNEPGLRRIYLVGVLLSISWDLFTFLMPILGHRSQLSASTIGAILATFAAGTFGVRMVMARLARSYNEWQILRSAIVVIVAVYVCLPIATAVPQFFALAFILGASVGSAQPNMLSLLHAAAPHGRGAEAVGFRAMLGSASAVAVPFLFGATAASLGLVPVFWSVAALIAAALPAAHRGTRK